jgi:hypothetical protein
VVVLLSPIAQVLPEVSVIDSASRGLEKFENRRKTRLGRFVTEADIRTAHGSRLSEIARTKIPGITVLNAPGGSAYVFSTRGSNTLTSGCQVVVYVDGVHISNGMLPLCHSGCSPVSSTIHLVCAVQFGFRVLRDRTVGA